MKVTKWWKKLSVAIAAAGIWVPSAALAVNIPLGDPSFEAYTVPAADGFAYAVAGSYSGAYRPTSPWVDDLDSPLSASNVQYVEDDAESNWIYNSAYSDFAGSTGHYRGAPRTGDQAMHGLGNYSAQKLTDTFQAGNTYTFSVWAQGDADASSSDDQIYLYIFDGTIPFNETSPGTLSVQGFQGGPGGTDFNIRAGANHAASIANWTQISISHFVASGAPEIGHPIGVAFYAYRDAAVDDASLTAVPEPATVLLVSMSGLSFLAFRRRRS